MSAAERVAKGVTWLDSNVPDWRGKVEVSKFDILSTCRCVLGQIFEAEAEEYDYDDGYSYAEDNLLSREQAVDLGFDAKYDFSTGLLFESDYRELQKEWLRVLCQ